MVKVVEVAARSRPEAAGHGEVSISDVWSTTTRPVAEEEGPCQFLL